jgi:hypothetical protein
MSDGQAAEQSPVAMKWELCVAKVIDVFFADGQPESCEAEANTGAFACAQLMQARRTQPSMSLLPVKLFQKVPGSSPSGRNGRGPNGWGSPGQTAENMPRAWEQ